MEPLSFRSCLYAAHISHARHQPVKNNFRYPAFSLYLDLDELPQLAKRLWFFSHNRWNILSFYDRDHGKLDGSAVRDWATDVCRDHLGITVSTVRLLCFPRLLGYVFNPISLFFCYDEKGALKAVLYEVCNAFKQRHTYAHPVTDDVHNIRHVMEKVFYVSPYLPMECVYHCHTHEPNEGLLLRIEETHKDAPILTAVYEGQHRPLTNARLCWYVVRYPLVTFAVTRRIWWQALKLAVKGLRFQRPPAMPPSAVS